MKNSYNKCVKWAKKLLHPPYEFCQSAKSQNRIACLLGLAAKITAEGPKNKVGGSILRIFRLGLVPFFGTLRFLSFCFSGTLRKVTKTQTNSPVLKPK